MIVIKLNSRIATMIRKAAHHVYDGGVPLVAVTDDDDVDDEGDDD